MLECVLRHRRSIDINTSRELCCTNSGKHRWMTKGQTAGGVISSSSSVDLASLLQFNAVASTKIYQRPSITVELCLGAVMM